MDDKNIPIGLVNEEFEILHREPEVSGKPETPKANPPPETSEDAVLPIGAELLAVLDAILGVDDDG